jgi:outer membrane protein assembly factor BamA
MTASTRNLPRHEQNAMGFASMIRGGTPNGRISTSVTGSTELRIPIQLEIPALKKIQEDSSFVLFGDWVSARKNNGSSFFFKKSIGIGVRKVTQGIPLKVDLSYVGDGKLKSTFGLGRDFDV